MPNTLKLPSGKRVATAIFMLLITFASFAMGGILLALYLSVFIYISTKEFVHIASAKGLNLPFNYIIFVEVALVALATFKLYSLIMPFLTLSILLAFLVIMQRGKQATINDLGGTILAFLYGGFFPMHITLLRDIKGTCLFLDKFELPIGIALIVFMLFVIAACDIAAYFIGKNIGKIPLNKDISPKKTLEGAIGGTLAGILWALLIGYIFGLNLVLSASTGLVILIVGQFGDLCESMLKRDAGIKDSGTLLPGHGGVLDRVDSYIFTGAASYYIFNYFLADKSILSVLSNLF